MKKNTPFLLLILAACLTFLQPSAQNTSPYWSLDGNSNASATASKLGTANAIPLRIFTSNMERIRIAPDGATGIGTTTPASWLAVNSAAGKTPFRAQIAGTTKLLVGSNGGVSIGAGSAPPANGLYVAGNAGIGTATPSQKLHVVGKGLITAGLTVSNGGISGFNTTTTGIGVYGEGESNGVYGTGYLNGVYGFSPFTAVYGSGYETGVKGEAINAGYNSTGAYSSTGVYGTASVTEYDISAYGVYGSANGYISYGIYGEAGIGSSNTVGYLNESFNAAGYFAGNVYAVKYITTSDRKFKTGITPLKNSLEQLMKLKPSAYEFNTLAYTTMGLPKGKQIGLIADEVKQVFPELVQQAVHPVKYSKDKKTVERPEVKYEGVNYQGLIPVLIASVQELNNENKKLKEEFAKRDKEQQQQMNELKEMVSKLVNGQSVKSGNNTLVNLSSAYLEQNSPNPFNTNTIIRYYVPSNVTNSKVVIMDMKGAVIKSIALNSKGSGQITLNASALAAGTYNYSLWVDNQQVDKKQMMVTR